MNETKSLISNKTISIMAKLSDKQHEQQQERRLAKLEKRADADDKIVANHKKRIIALEKQVKELRQKLKNKK